jgi:hypothetical protein
MRRHMLTAVASLAILALASNATAQAAGGPSGIALTGGPLAAMLSVQNAGDVDWYGGEQGTAPGIHLGLGWAFPNGLSLFLSGAGAGMFEDLDGDAYTFGAGGFAVRYAFQQLAVPALPFVELALGSQLLSYDELKLELSGWQLMGGAGAAWFLTPKLALEGALHFGTGRLNNIKVENVSVDLESGDQPNSTFGRVSLGLMWYPMAQRGVATRR